MKKIVLALSAIALSVTASVSASEGTLEDKLTLPASYDSVFQKSMQDPNVLFYYGATSFERGDYDKSLKWMLEASRYDHPDAIENVKHMIKYNQGTAANREGVVDFLSFFARARGDDAPDIFAQIYLADYYRGDSCVWYAPEERATCVINSSNVAHEPMSATDLEKSYFYFEGAAEQGDQRSKFTAGMMNILGLGVPRNVPLGLDFLRPIAESGQSNVAYIIGKTYQDGYWMVQDRKQASAWFEKAISYTQHPDSMLEMAKNYESGVIGANQAERNVQAVALYEKALSSVSATIEVKAEAAFRLGLVYTNFTQYRDEVKAIDYMSKAVSLSSGKPNEFGVKALIWLGDKEASQDLSEAVSLYHKAETMLETLPLNVKQRQATVWQKIANAHATGQKGNLEKSQRDYAFFMNKYHRVMSKTYVPSKDADSYVGFSAFSFPG
jgi:TPR repeat protein